MRCHAAIMLPVSRTPTCRWSPGRTSHVCRLEGGARRYMADAAEQLAKLIPIVSGREASLETATPHGALLLMADPEIRTPAHRCALWQHMQIAPWLGAQIWCCCRAAFVETFQQLSSFRLVESAVEPVVLDDITSSIRLMRFQAGP